MARPKRIEYPGAWYHVMNRGAGEKAVFLSDKDRLSFLDLLGEVTKVFKVEVHAYSLMDNHYHLLLHTPQGGLSRAMKHLNGKYVQKFNSRHVTDGPLFRGRYKALLVDSEEYLLELVRYIHLNPVEARVCKTPSEHRWTSHRAYLRGPEKANLWLATEKAINRFGQNRGLAKKAFHQFVCAGVPKGFRRRLREQTFILGNKDFRERVYENCGKSDGQETY